MVVTLVLLGRLGATFAWCFAWVGLATRKVHASDACPFMLRCYTFRAFSIYIRFTLTTRNLEY